MSDDPLLSVEGLTKHYPITKGVFGREVGRVRAVDGIDFEIRRGETFGLIGETGCGKSTAAETLLRLEEPTEGTVTFDGEEVTAYDGGELKRFRRRAQMIFQDPTSSFDPRMSIGESAAEPLSAHGMADGERRRGIVESMLERVGLGAEAYGRYPHELSGGQKQRAALARALVVDPDLLVADEPVSALDVSVQAEILSLLEGIQRDFDLSILFITHDMNVVREVCDRVAVMYLGELVETGPSGALLSEPRHPYTRALVASIPTPDPDAGGREVTLTGDVPDPSDPPEGCRFHTRCPEIIQPEGYDLDQAAWRGLMDLRTAIEADEFDREALWGLAGASGDATPSEDALRRTLREEYDLPDSLSDPDAEAVLETAIEEVVAGDADAAADRLATAFATPCAERHPEMRDRDADHPAACHLHDPSVPSDSTRESDFDIAK